MKKKKGIIAAAVIVIAAMGFMLTYQVDLLPSSLEEDENAIELEAKGKVILAKAWQAHGIDSLNSHQVYQMTLVDDWQGMMAGMGKLWDEKNSKMVFKYVPGTFDAQIEYLDGVKKGEKAGLQAWTYYEQAVGGPVDFEVETNVRAKFGMAAFQYFAEMVGRLSNAELIRYAGEESFNGNRYDLVFATWGTLSFNPVADQYIMYINQETNMLDYVKYTLRDNYLDMPGSAMFYGSMGFSDYKEIDGFQVPFTQSAFMNGMSENNDDYIHQLKIESFSFDGFDKDELYPNVNLGSLGDSK